MSIHTVSPKSATTLNITLGTVEDIPSIMKLNQQWLVSDPDKADTSKGFLFGESLSEEDLIKIISEGELAVAKKGDLLVGYYLFDNYSSTSTLKAYEGYIAELTRIGSLPEGVKLSKRAQAAVSKEYQNQGLSKMLFNHLLLATGDKYDLLFLVVSKLNPKLIAHQRAGWKIIGENEHLYFVTYSFEKDTKR